MGRLWCRQGRYPLGSPSRKGLKPDGRDVPFIPSDPLLAPPTKAAPLVLVLVLGRLPQTLNCTPVGPLLGLLGPLWSLHSLALAFWLPHLLPHLQCFQ